MKLSNIQENVDELAARRELKRNREQDENNAAAASAIQDMKDDLVVTLTASIDALIETGMDEEYAISIIMTHLGDVIMAHDLDNDA